MLYRPSSFKKSAFALTAVAALASASGLTTFSANAQQAVNYTGTAACAPYPVGTDRALKCAIEQSQIRTKAANQRTETAQNSTSCMEAIGKKIEIAKKAGPLSPEQKAMFKTQIEHCDKT